MSSMVKYWEKKLIMRRAIAGLIAIAGVGAETGFMERTSGRCTDESGWGWVGSEAECEEGARGLGLGWDS